MPKFLSLLVLLPSLLAGGCSLLPEQVDETRDWSAATLYSRAREALTDGNHETAIRYYETLEARYPFGRYAQQALLESAYAYYKFSEPDSAIAAAERFIKMYPRHPHVDYAWYLKGLANFARGDTIIDRILPRDPSERDPGAARQAFLDFSELVERFPDSKYAPDAALRTTFLRNNLARYELHAADYYLRRGAPVAAVNRARYVLENYPRTPAVADALAVLVHGYRRLGLEDLAGDALRVLALNHPEHPLLNVPRPQER